MRAALFAALLLPLGTLAALGGEKIKFKNGHTLLAESVRVEGDVVYVKTSDGSEAGFPKALVEIVEEAEYSPPSTYRGNASSPRGIHPETLPGATKNHANRPTEGSVTMRGSLNDAGSTGKRLTAGFSYRGAINVTEASRRNRRGPTANIADRGAGGGGEAGPTYGATGTSKKKSGPAKVLQPRVANKPGRQELR